MKKSVYILFFSSLLLGACSSSEGSADVSKLEATIQSLEKENQELKDMLGETETVTESTESKEKEAPKEDTLASVGEEVTISDQDGNEMYSLKIIEATTSITPDSVATYDDSYKNLLEVKYEYKNYNMDQAMSISTQFLSAYNEEGKAGSDLGYMDGQTEVSKGKSSVSTMWFEMPEDPSAYKNVEIDYSNDFSLGFDGTISFKVPVNH